MKGSILRGDGGCSLRKSIERRRGARIAILLAGCAWLAAPQAALAIPDGSLDDSPAVSDIIPPKVYTTTPGGVNVADGSFTYSVTDLSMGSLTLQRHHVPGLRKSSNPLMGNNMSHNFDIYVAPNVKPSEPPPFARPIRYQPIVHIGASASGIYQQNPSFPATIGPWNDDGQAGHLAWSGGNYVYTDSSGTIYTFTAAVPATGPRLAHSQRVARIDFPGGRRQSFTYNASHQLRLVSDTSGYAIVFDYNAAGRVSTACAFNLSQTYVTASTTCTGAALKTSYTYDYYGAMLSATDVEGQTTTYPGNYYAGIPCVMRPGESVCQVANDYDPEARVFRQTLADGSVWTMFSARPDVVNETDLPAIDGDSTASFTDPSGITTNFSFTKSTPFTATDPNGNTTSYRFRGAMLYDFYGQPYSDGSMLVEAVLPGGNRYAAEYLGPYNSITRQTMTARPGSGLPDLEQLYGYGGTTSQNAAKPIWIRDANGNQSDFTYAAHGGLLTEMRAAPTTGAARPLKVVTYAQRYAYIRNSGGTLVPAATAVWQPATETLCQTAAGSSTPVCDAAAPRTVITFEYGANGTADNLLLRARVVSDGTTSRRTCFGYDPRGNRISETEPRGTSPGVCP